MGNSCALVAEDGMGPRPIERTDSVLCAAPDLVANSGCLSSISATDLAHYAGASLTGSQILEFIEFHHPSVVHPISGDRLRRTHPGKEVIDLRLQLFAAFAQLVR